MLPKSSALSLNSLIMILQARGYLLSLKWPSNTEAKYGRFKRKQVRVLAKTIPPVIYALPYLSPFRFPEKGHSSSSEIKVAKSKVNNLSKRLPSTMFSNLLSLVITR